jgi:thiamine-phosphate pyrophosphorylase
VTAAAGRRPGRVYAIADVERLGVDRVVAAVIAMAEAGVETVQLRAKRQPDAELERLVDATRRALMGWSGMFWIDDRADVARLFGLDGVQLGQRDLPPGTARRWLPSGCLIGASTHDREQLLAADGDPAVDWIALGPIFPTSSKRDPDPAIGIERLRELRAESDKPLIAIGGLGLDGLAAALEAGADSVALLSALCDGDVGANCRRALAAVGTGP